MNFSSQSARMSDASSAASLAHNAAELIDTADHDLHLSARGVDIFYGEKQAIQDVNIDIPDRAVMAFIGPSGCGKSTFLRALNRMNDTIEGARVAGTITIDNQNIYDSRIDPVQLRARVGMVFQKPNPFPKSIFDNIAYGPMIHGLVSNKKDLGDLVKTSLERVGLLSEVERRLDEPDTSL